MLDSIIPPFWHGFPVTLTSSHSWIVEHLSIFKVFNGQPSLSKVVRGMLRWNLLAVAFARRLQVSISITSWMTGPPKKADAHVAGNPWIAEDFSLKTRQKYYRHGLQFQLLRCGFFWPSCCKLWDCNTPLPPVVPSWAVWPSCASVKEGTCGSVLWLVPFFCRSGGSKPFKTYDFLWLS